MQSYTTREEWLQAALVMLFEMVFADAGISPAAWQKRRYRVTCGFPIGYRGSRTGKAIVLGQAFDASVSADGTMEVCINPIIDEPVEVLRILAHEFIHVWAGIECGHRGEFARIAKAIGFTGPMTQTPATPALLAKLTDIADVLGTYPHAKIDPSLRKKQGTRMLKMCCSDCGFTSRVSAKWGERITEHSTCPVCHSVGTLSVG
tara:strand:- start:69 stop:680 length:612 start_codon:yes stop_codon:yes gene_type:complete